MKKNTEKERTIISDRSERFKLGALFDFSNVVNASLDLKFVLGHFLLTLMGKLLSLRSIVLLERKSGIYVVENIKGLPPDLMGSEYTIRRVPKSIMYVNSKTIKSNSWLKLFQKYELNLIVPLVAHGRSVGIAGFAPKLPTKKLTANEATYVKSLANIAAIAIEKGLFINELNNVNRQLDKKIRELYTLFDVGKELNSVFDKDQIIKLLLFSIMGQIGTNRYLLCLDDYGDMKIVASRFETSPSKSVCANFYNINNATLVENIKDKNATNWKSEMLEAGIKVLVPLKVQNKTKGILALGDKMHGEIYTRADLEFLTSLGNIAMISLENARLFKEAIEKQRMEDELLIAREIQKGLLPSSLPGISGFDCAAINISSREVGGDYYDIIQLSQNHFLLAIGDVSGKSSPASLLMANLQATIRALAPLGLSLSELTSRVNDLICDNTSGGRFITFFWGLLHSDSRKLQCVNAGHNPPFLVRSDGSVERLTAGGMLLGILKSVQNYEESEVCFKSGDVLVMFTDGVSEAMNTQGEEFGENSILEIIKTYQTESSEKIMQEIINKVNEHSAGTIQSDDITMVVVKAT